MGQSIKNATRFQTLDAIIPLPLYPDKLKIRGFNQAAIIAQGMSSIMQVPVIDLNLQRKRYTETQTKKQRNERWLNVADSFHVDNPNELMGKHLLLVDDVVTTGATLEASGSVLLQIAGVQLSIATLMYAIKR
jgi:ComF family protein